MTIGLLFWILMILWLILGFFTVSTPWGWGSVGLIFVLFALVGWKLFGPPVHA
jgi:hypothetical protein